MNSIIYEMKEFVASPELFSEALLVAAVDDEARSKYAIGKITSFQDICGAAIVFTYGEMDKYGEVLQSIESVYGAENVNVIEGFTNSQYEFITQMQTCESLINAKKIIIDISCILTPYLFLIMKCIYMWNHDATIYAINTIPYDYSFPESPFLSYKSYYGDLKMEEIIGFSSSEGMRQKKDLFIFAGFEGALALKVEEDIEYSQLYYVNALPSYYQKYKDISIINNYQLLLSKNCKRLYAPAINPFEVYNLLDGSIDESRSVSIAPLCTKPMSLGICMYALEHHNVRIVYPFSDQYESHRSYDVYKSYIYKIPREW